LSKILSRAKSSSSSTILLCILIFVATSILTVCLLQQTTLAQQQQGSNNSYNQQEEKEQKENKAIVVAYVEAVNNRNLSALDKIVSKDIIVHDTEIQSGLNATKQFIKTLLVAFPDLHVTLDHIIAEDDKVVAFTTANGTHKGILAFAPVNPTGKHISAKSADLYKISNGKIVEQWDITDVLDVLTKIGAVK
jgi:steroid delta-isomerase-like uncharacterized protein